jgi:hypothetical protein
MKSNRLGWYSKWRVVDIFNINNWIIFEYNSYSNIEYTYTYVHKKIKKNLYKILFIYI